MSNLSPQVRLTEIKLIHIHYHVGAFALFKSLNAHFQSKITAIIGANSSGKSTLLRLISGFSCPTAGQVLVNGKDIYRHHDMKKNMGYVSAEPFLYPHLTVIENLKWVATLRNVTKQDFLTRSESLLQQSALMPYSKVLFGKLSSGIKKRVSLISQLLHHPLFLILDEPCSDLDPHQRSLLWGLLAQLSENHMIIFSSHHPQEITSLCDSILLLKEGQLKHYSKTEEFSQILLQPALSTLTHDALKKEPNK